MNYLHTTTIYLGTLYREATRMADSPKGDSLMGALRLFVGRPRDRFFASALFALKRVFASGISWHIWQRRYSRWRRHESQRVSAMPASFVHRIEVRQSRQTRLPFRQPFEETSPGTTARLCHQQSGSMCRAFLFLGFGSLNFEPRTLNHFWGGEHHVE
jgi:hypothetical protein